MKTYAIHWESTVNGNVGTGTKLFEKEDAERLAAELNDKYPEIEHRAVIPLPKPAEPVAVETTLTRQELGFNTERFGPLRHLDTHSENEDGAELVWVDVAPKAEPLKLMPLAHSPNSDGKARANCLLLRSAAMQFAWLAAMVGSGWLHLEPVRHCPPVNSGD